MGTFDKSLKFSMDSLAIPEIDINSIEPKRLITRKNLLHAKIISIILAVIILAVVGTGTITVASIIQRKINVTNNGWWVSFPGNYSVIVTTESTEDGDVTNFDYYITEEIADDYQQGYFSDDANTYYSYAPDTEEYLPTEVIHPEDYYSWDEAREKSGLDLIEITPNGARLGEINVNNVDHDQYTVTALYTYPDGAKTISVTYLYVSDNSISSAHWMSYNGELERTTEYTTKEGYRITLQVYKDKNIEAVIAFKNYTVAFRFDGFSEREAKRVLNKTSLLEFSN